MTISTRLTIVLALAMLAAPPEAGAHVFPMKRALTDARSAAREWAATGQEFGEWVARGSGVRSCRRASAHRVRCRVYIRVAVELREEETFDRIGWRLYTCGGTHIAGYLRSSHRDKALYSSTALPSSPEGCPYVDELSG